MGTTSIRRPIFYAAAILSAILLALTLLLWPTSYYRVSSAGYLVHDKAALGLHARNGRLWFLYHERNNLDPTGFFFATSKVNSQGYDHWNYLTWNTPATSSPVSQPTFLGVLILPYDPSHQTCLMLIPFSYLTLLFSILPALVLRSHLPRKASRVCLCPRCCYDLRAHTPGSLCPECGTPIKTQRA